MIPNVLNDHISCIFSMNDSYTRGKCVKNTVTGNRISNVSMRFWLFFYDVGFSNDDICLHRFVREDEVNKCLYGSRFQLSLVRDNAFN